MHGKRAVEQKPLTFLPDTGSHVAVCGLFSGRRISLGVDCYHFFFFFFLPLQTFIKLSSCFFVFFSTDFDPRDNFFTFLLSVLFICFSLSD